MNIMVKFVWLKRSLKMIWSLILLQIAATVVAVADENFSRSAYFITRENKRLANSFVRKKIESPSLLTCSHACLRNSWCTSTNFNYKGQNMKGTCEFNEFAPINDDSKLMDQLGTSFTMMLKGCLMTGCLNGGSCLFDKKKETFTCSCKLAWIGEKCEEFAWRKLNTVPVCFGAKNNEFGRFNVSVDSGSVDAVKLVHVSGSVRCGYGRSSKWCCAGNSPHICTLLTTSKNVILLPESKEYEYTIPGYDEDSKEIVFPDLLNPLLLSSGQELRLWYSEDLRDTSESDNGGTSCADVYAKYI